MSHLLNDTMLTNSTLPLLRNISDHAVGWFAPGLNIGFIALVGLAIMYHEDPKTPMLGCLITYLFAWCWGNNFGLFSFLLVNWLKIVGLTAIYICIGAIWTVPKWWIYVRKSKNHEKFKDKLHQKILNTQPQNLTDTEKRYNAAREIVSENKYRFYTWIVWWPLNMLYTFSRDPLTLLYNYVYSKLTSTFTTILLQSMPDSKDDEIKGDIFDDEK